MADHSKDPMDSLDRVRARLEAQADAARLAREEQKERETHDREPHRASGWVRRHKHILVLIVCALLLIGSGVYIYSQYRYISGAAFLDGNRGESSEIEYFDEPPPTPQPVVPGAGEPSP